MALSIFLLLALVYESVDSYEEKLQRETVTETFKFKHIFHIRKGQQT